MKRRIALITASPMLVQAFVRDDALHRRLDLEIPLVVRIHPSMKPIDRVRDVHATIARRARINQTSFVAQTLHYFAYRRLARMSKASDALAGALADLYAGRRVVEATTVNDPAIVAALQTPGIALGLVMGGDVFTRRTLEALDLPLFNLHLSDPAFVRGIPPVFWEVLAGRDTVTPTLHRLTATLDGGDVIHQQECSIVWRPTLRETLDATHECITAAVPAMLEEGLRLILDGHAHPRPIVPGPLRTWPTIGQIRAAARICRARAAASSAPTIR